MKTKLTEKAKNYINSLPEDQKEPSERDLIRAANRIARKHGYNNATLVDVRFDKRDKVIDSRAFGFFKNSDGQRVPTSYYNKAWRSCHYGHSIFEVQIGVKDLWAKI